MSDEERAPGLESVSVCVPDHYGRLAGKRVAAARLDSLAQTGLAMPDFHLVRDTDNHPVAGLSATGPHTGFPNDVLWPVPETLRRLPWDPATGIMLAEARRPDGTLIPEAPRAILRHQVDRLAEHGLSAWVASELEFYVFENSYAQAAGRRFRELTPLYHRNGDNDVLVTGFLEPYLRPLREAMAGLEFPAEATQAEGGIGQVEMNFPPSGPMVTADNHVLFKHTAKVIAQRQARSVTFMAKLDESQAGSSCHLHLSLRDSDGEPSTAANGELSRVARRFLAGLLAFSPELMLMHAPFANSYRRLQPGSWAPATVTWGYDNRSVMVRVLGEGASLRMEFRLPGADANPYHSIAAVLAAGLAGLEDDQIELPPAVSGDAYEALDRRVLPGDLTEAIQRFGVSKLARRVFGDDVHGHVTGMARHQLAMTRRAVTDWDIEHGFENA